MLKAFLLNIIKNLKGENIIHFDIRERSNIADDIIICTGTSNRHVISMAQNILKKIKKTKIIPYYGIEGIKYGEWVLVDLGEVIIHIMKQETRELYALEKLWR